MTDKTPRDGTMTQAETLRSVGERIKKRRIDLELSQDQLATEAGVSKGYVTQFEKGVKELGWTTFWAVAKALRTNPLFLATGEGPADPWPWPEEMVPEWMRVPPELRAHLVGIARWAVRERPAQDELATRRAQRAQSQPQPLTRRVPLVHAVAAGRPLSEADDLGDEFEVPADLPGDAIVQVRGESMNRNIPDGSLLLCRNAWGTRGYDQGDLVVARVEGRVPEEGTTVKRYRRGKRRADERRGTVRWLVPDSDDPQHRAVRYWDGDDTRQLWIAGVVEAMLPRGTGTWVRIERVPVHDLPIDEKGE